MEKKSGHKAFAWIFLSCLFAFSIANYRQAHEALMDEMATFEFSDIVDDLSDLNKIMENQILGRYQWLEGYGAVQLAMGKKEENSFEIVKDKDGFLYSGNFWAGFGDNQRSLAIRMGHLQDNMRIQGAKTGFILCPMRYVQAQAKYKGIPYNDHSIESEDFLRWMRYYGVPYLDLRETVESLEIPYEEKWFRTDHYWMPTVALEGYWAVTNWLEKEFGESIYRKEYYDNPEHYESEVYEDAMFGYYGRDSGILFAGGAEDYKAVFPKDDGSTYRWESGEEVRGEGDFSEAFLNKDIGTPNLYDLNAGSFYLGEIENESILFNDEIENGLSVLIIGDAFATPVGTFLAQNCSRVEVLWSKQYTPQEIEKRLTERQYDYVLVMLSEENLSDKNLPFYVE